MTRTRRMWAGWAGTAMATTAVLGLVVAPAYVGDGLRHVIMVGFSGVCHQIPIRSPHLNGVQLAVCDRCLGVYVALAAASMLYPVLRHWSPAGLPCARYFVLAAVVVPGTDWLGDVVGVWANTPASRMLTGAVFGGVAGLLLAGAVVDLVSQRKVDGAPARPRAAVDERGSTRPDEVR